MFAIFKKLLVAVAAVVLWIKIKKG